ncbi:MAG: DUF924 family protein [Polaromonas sp.]
MSPTTPRTLSQPDNSLPTPTDILDFWLGDGMDTAQGWPTQALNKRWFQGDAALDQEIRTRFGERVVQALGGHLQDWEAPLASRLALVILLDQFTRNVFRASAQAFEGDVRAQRLVLQTLQRHEDTELPWVGRVFMYMPLMHAETLALQQESVARFSSLLAEAPDPLKPQLQGNLDFARQHHDIIAKFGRFPYRNAVLGRISTPQEQDFLRTGPRFGQ